MLKFIYCYLVLIVTILKAYSSQQDEIENLIGLLKPNPCPNYSAQPNIDQTKVSSSKICCQSNFLVLNMKKSILSNT